MENFKTPLSLKMLDFILPVFLGKKVEYSMVRKILLLKLTLDKRRPISGQKRQSNKESKDMRWINYISYGAIGIFIAFIQMMNNYFLANIIGYAMLMFILISVYISEYSEVLLDTKEKPFFSVLPIGKRELSVAKNIHIALCIGGVAGSVLLPSIILGGIRYGFAYAFLYLLMGMGVSIFCLQLTSSLYFFLLKKFSGEKLKDVLNYFQVTMTIIIVVSYQILPRVINFRLLNQLQIKPTPYLFIVPPAWFASFFAILFQGQRSVFFFALFLVGILVVAAMTVLNNRVILPHFEEQLGKLEENSTENTSLSWKDRMFCKVFSKNRQERGYMEMMSIHLSRDRNLKLKLYPQLTNAVILPCIMVFSILIVDIDKGFGYILKKIQAGPYYLSLYFVVAISTSVYAAICQTDNPESTWIYKILPIENMSMYIRAGIKVVLFHYLTPLFALVGVCFFLLYKGKILLDLTILYLSFLLLSSLVIYLTAWELPFSVQTDANTSGSRVAIILLSFFVLGIWAGVHYFAFKTTVVKSIVVPCLIGMNFLWWKFGMHKEYKLGEEES